MTHGYTYDSTQYTVTVTVVDNNDGTLTVAGILALLLTTKKKEENIQ